jgi:hypothetical protein
MGIQFSRAVNATVSTFGRAEFVHYGAFEYDDANSAGQEAYGLANLRAGVQLRGATIEAWVKPASVAGGQGTIVRRVVEQLGGGLLVSGRSGLYHGARFLVPDTLSICGGGSAPMALYTKEV